jgi:RNA polymerase sigma-70 factor (ECF subfamily)
MDRSPSPTETVQQLFVKHVPAIRAFILAFLPDFNRADDILQESFLTVTAKADAFQPGTNFLAWATAIAKLKILEYRRQTLALGQTFSPEVIDALCTAAPMAPPADELQARLRECLDDLPPSARKAIDLRYGEACKPVEVARRLNWKPEAVYVALSRARTTLRDCIKLKMKRQEIR